MPEHSGLISTIIRPDAGFHTVMWMDFLMPSIGIETEQTDSALPYGGGRNSWLPAIKDIDLRHDNELQRMLARLDQPSRLRFAHPASNMPGHPSRMIGIYVEHTLLGALGLYNCGRPGHTDVALVVDQQWRCRGTGMGLAHGRNPSRCRCASEQPSRHFFSEKLADATTRSQGQRQVGSADGRDFALTSPSHRQTIRGP